MVRFRLGHLPAFRRIVDYLSDTGGWVVVVVPTISICLEDLRTVGMGCYPMGTKHVGRTSVLPNGARLTVLGVGEDLEGTGFDVVFLGFEGDTKDKDIVRRGQWRHKARRVLTSSGETGMRSA